MEQTRLQQLIDQRNQLIGQHLNIIRELALREDLLNDKAKIEKNMVKLSEQIDAEAQKEDEVKKALESKDDKKKKA